MIILTLVAFLAGVVTILSPCILPILPAVLAAGVSGGKRRPLGIVVGLVVSFTFFTLTLSFLVRRFDINAEFLRTLAIIVLLLFGTVLLIPRLGSWLEVWISRRLPQTKLSRGSGFWDGILVGISLGLVWTPCVGPIMASVITLAATSSISLESVIITVAYVIGTSIPLLVLMYGGKRLLARATGLGPYTVRIQQVFGGLMVLTAIAMFAGLDLAIESELLAKLPASITSGITQQFEESSSVQNQLKTLKGTTNAVPGSAQIVAGSSSGLPDLGKAPDFTGITGWLNSPPLTLSQLSGKVVLVDFWTYSCINCIRSLPHVISWYDTYKNQGFVVVGVEAPEFAFEQNTANVAQAIKQFGIPYPVAQDNNLATWNAYSNEYWPAEYLIDAQGRLRASDFGEGDYSQMEENIRSLLVEEKQIVPSMPPEVTDQTPSEAQSPETYLGSERQSGYQANISASSLTQDEWTLGGNWQVGDQYITSTTSNATLSYDFIGKNIYLVLNPPDSLTINATVTLDGKPIGAQAGADDPGGVLTITNDRLYHLASVSDPSTSHIVTITFQQAGVKAFSFTFG